MTRKLVAGIGFCACVPVAATKDHILHTTEFTDDAAQTAVRTHLANLARHGGRDAGRAASPAPMLVICDPGLATWLLHDGRARRTTAGRTVFDTASITALPDIIEGGEAALRVYLEAFARTLAASGFGVHLIAREAPPAQPRATDSARRPGPRHAHVMQPASAHSTADPDRRIRVAR